MWRVEVFVGEGKVCWRVLGRCGKEEKGRDDKVE